MALWPQARHAAPNEEVIRHAAARGTLTWALETAEESKSPERMQYQAGVCAGVDVASLASIIEERPRAHAIALATA
eukprot:6194311-Pleurochrysis_carterae.AAC.2